MQAVIKTIMEEEVVPIIGGGAHYSLYTNAFQIKLLSRYGIQTVRESLDVIFDGTKIGFINIPTIISDPILDKDVVIISSNNMIVEKDIQDAKRILRFSNGKFNNVYLVNVDWYNNCTYEIVTCDGI